MKGLTIYYDDTKRSCQEFAEAFSKYEQVVCVRASDYKRQQIIFAPGKIIGLIFESERGKVPQGIERIISKIVASKTETHLIIVTGGSREFDSARTASVNMARRGYTVKNIYTKYLFEKNKLDVEAAADRIICDMEEEKETIHVLKKYRNDLKDENKKGLSSYLREGIRQYRLEKKRQSKV